MELTFTKVSNPTINSRMQNHSSSAAPSGTAEPIEGQLNAEERRILMAAVKDSPIKPRVVLEVGTWLGGGSTVHLLRALEENGEGHLWGIEADETIYQRMVENIRRAAPAAAHRFTPVFGLSQRVIPGWLENGGPSRQVDVVFLDGGNNPAEQITEFKLLDPRIPVGGQLLSHDAKLRKGKWLVPYVSRLDNWKSTLHDVSGEGLFHARKIAPAPSAESLRNAERHLLKMRMNPIEITGRILPSWLCGLILRVIPTRLARSISDGRK